jgi:ribonuclease HI
MFYNYNIITRQRISDKLDGGVHDYNSNFGMVIAVTSKIVATNKGKIYSVAFHESSYRSEMLEVLATIVSLQYIIKKHKMEVANNKHLKFYCDNSSVIKLLDDRQDMRHTVNQHRYPDVDIELQILYELRQLHKSNCITTFKHVKGHQDTDTT